MSHHKNEEFAIHHHAEGAHDLKDTWELRETEYPVIKEAGEFIWQALYVSVDPYMSSAIRKVPVLGGETKDVGTVQVGHVTAKVIESRNESYPVGTIFVSSGLPWRRFGLTKGEPPGYKKIVKKPNEPENFFDRLGLSSTIGALGMPTQTAYYGAVDVAKFTEKDVVVVSGAAGAVGLIVGQIAKKIAKAKKVIGIAGGKTKCDFLVNELGFDAAIDYKEYNTEEKMTARIKELAGEPVTAYFDNTGGFITNAIFNTIARHGRLIICGQISAYTKKAEKPEDLYIFPNYLAKTVYAALTIQGFIVFDYTHRNETEFFVDVPKWIESGTIKTAEHLVEGFENLPKAYEMLYTGANIGKIVVKV